MRVLFTSYSDKSIFRPMVPLAWALRTAGHEVRVAGQPRFAETITQAGLTAVPVGRDAGFWRVAKLDPVWAETYRQGLPDPYRAAVQPPGEITYHAMKTGYEQIVVRWHELENFPILAGLVSYARSWKPDLVIWEPTTYAGAIAAQACGAAHARLLWSIDVFGVTRDRFLHTHTRQPAAEQADPLGHWLACYANKYGVDYTEDLVTGHFTIDHLPPSLRMTADLQYLPMQYIPYGGPAVVPGWLSTPPRRPRVALTLGTTATDRFAGYNVAISDILAALGELDIELIATIAESEQSKLTHIPDNTRVVDRVPLHALAPTCTAIINHAGPGTLLTIARHRVPQLTLPWDFDEPELARRAARQGAAITVPADQATGPTVREHLLRLLHEPAFADHATRLGDEIHNLDTPNQLVPQLEELTAKHRTTLS